MHFADEAMGTPKGYVTCPHGSEWRRTAIQMPESQKDPSALPMYVSWIDIFIKLNYWKSRIQKDMQNTNSALYYLIQKTCTSSVTLLETLLNHFWWISEGLITELLAPASAHGPCFEEHCSRLLGYEDMAVSSLIDRSLIAIGLISTFTSEALNNTQVGNTLKHS